MARKVAYITIEAEGRDQGKCYRITEMPASQAEAWAARAMLGLARGQVDVPSGLFEQGMAGIAVLAVRGLGGIPWQEAKPLMDEMLGCVMMVPAPDRHDVVRPLIEDDIEEIATRLRLRDEWIKLHTGFSIHDALLRSTGASDGTGVESAPGPNIETFRARSAP